MKGDEKILREGGFEAGTETKNPCFCWIQKDEGVERIAEKRSGRVLKKKEMDMEVIKEWCGRK